MHTTPFLSIVVVSRNDNHGHSLNYRMQEFINLLAFQVERFNIQSELIIVEWNPPKLNKKLVDEFTYPSISQLAVKIIEVPEEIHRRYKYSEQQALYQMIGKNVGIARSSGKYILSTNIDIIFSDHVFKFIKKHLKENCLYTAVRCDIPNPLPKVEPLEKIKWSSENFFRVHDSFGSLILTRNSHFFYSVFGKIYVIYCLYIKNILTSKNKTEILSNNFFKKNFEYLTKFFSSLFELTYKLFLIFISFRKNLKCGSIKQILAFADYKNIWTRKATNAYTYLINLIKLLRWRFDGTTNLFTKNCLFNTYLNIKYKFVKLYDFSYNTFRSISKVLDLPHTNACGDFTLCSKNVWHTLRGYPEWDMQSWHLDSIFIYQAKNSGFNIKTLKGKIFHIEHSPGSGYTPEHANLLFDRLRVSGIRFLTNDEFCEITDQQLMAIKPIIYNNKYWGITDLDLPETKIN